MQQQPDLIGSADAAQRLGVTQGYLRALARAAAKQTALTAQEEERQRRLQERLRSVPNDPPSQDTIGLPRQIGRDYLGTEEQWAGLLAQSRREGERRGKPRGARPHYHLVTQDGQRGPRIDGWSAVLRQMLEWTAARRAEGLTVQGSARRGGYHVTSPTSKAPTHSLTVERCTQND